VDGSRDELRIKGGRVEMSMNDMLEEMRGDPVYEQEGRVIKLEELAIALDEYCSLISDELDDVLPYAEDRGWRSKRGVQRKLLRDRIEYWEAQLHGSSEDE